MPIEARRTSSIFGLNRSPFRASSFALGMCTVLLAAITLKVQLLDRPAALWRLIGRFSSPDTRLVFESPFTGTDGRPYHVLVFDKQWHDWPGWQPQTVVVASDNGRVVLSQSIGGSPIFQSAVLKSTEEGPALVMRHMYRGVPKIGTSHYRLSPNAVERTGKVLWGAALEDEWWHDLDTAAE